MTILKIEIQIIFLIKNHKYSNNKIKKTFYQKIKIMLCSFNN